MAECSDNLTKVTVSIVVLSNKYTAQISEQMVNVQRSFRAFVDIQRTIKESILLSPELPKMKIALFDSHVLVRRLEEHKFVESAKYFRNALERYESFTAVGFSDCKTNCRSALIALVSQLTNESDLKKALTVLGKGIFGERETEVIHSLLDFTLALHHLLSKRGPHPPTAGKEEAELSLEATRAIMRYMLTKSGL